MCQIGIYESCVQLLLQAKTNDVTSVLFDTSGFSDVQAEVQGQQVDFTLHEPHKVSSPLVDTLWTHGLFIIKKADAGLWKYALL